MSTPAFLFAPPAVITYVLALITLMTVQAVRPVRDLGSTLRLAIGAALPPVMFLFSSAVDWISSSNPMPLSAFGWFAACVLPLPLLLERPPASALRDTLFLDLSPLGVWLLCMGTGLLTGDSDWYFLAVPVTIAVLAAGRLLSAASWVLRNNGPRLLTSALWWGGMAASPLAVFVALLMTNDMPLLAFPLAALAALAYVTVFGSLTIALFVLTKQRREETQTGLSEYVQ